MAAETCQKVCAISQRRVFQISILFVLTPCLQATDGNVVMAVVYLPSTVPLLVTDAGRNIRVGSDINQGGPAGLGPTLRRPPSCPRRIAPAEQPELLLCVEKIWDGD